MRFALVSEQINPDRMWSGTVHYMLRALEDAGFDIIYVPPVWPRITQALNLLNKTSQAMGLGSIMLNRTRFVAQRKARALSEQVSKSGGDVIFAPVSATFLPFLETDQPIVYVSDATVPRMLDYYSSFTNVSAAMRNRAMRQENAALRRADLLLFPTEWAASSAIEDYGVDPAKVMVAPFGPNIEDAPSREAALAPRQEGPLRLLFCGVDWVRKGGDLALQTLGELNDMGHPATMTIVGCTPPAPLPNALADKVAVIPFLNKSDPDERARFRQLFLDADFLLLPTRAECFGMVFCEAAACGTPSISTITGGVPEVIQHEKTGLTLPLESSGGAYARAIAALLESPEDLEQMRKTARDDFETRLNWESWGQAVRDRVTDLLSAPSDAPPPPKPQ